MDIIKPIKKDQFNRAYSFKVHCPYCYEEFTWYRFKPSGNNVPDFWDLDGEKWMHGLGAISCTGCGNKIDFDII